MNGSLHPSSPLYILFRIGSAIDPRTCLRCTLVCHEWNTILKRNDFWHHYKSRVLSILPCLAGVFDAYPLTWQAFAYVLWRYTKEDDLYTWPIALRTAVILASHSQPERIKEISQSATTNSIRFAIEYTQPQQLTICVLFGTRDACTPLLSTKIRRTRETYCNVIVFSGPKSVFRSIVLPKVLLGPYLDIIYCRPHRLFRNGSGQPMKEWQTNPLFCE